MIFIYRLLVSAFLTYSLLKLLLPFGFEVGTMSYNFSLTTFTLLGTIQMYNLLSSIFATKVMIVTKESLEKTLEEMGEK